MLVLLCLGPSDREAKLSFLENFATLGDACAKETRERLRIVVDGGDGTVGWVLGCLGELHKQGRDLVPPTTIIPLGTETTYPRISVGWNLVISIPAGAELDIPYALKQTEEIILDQGDCLNKFLATKESSTITLA
ncbi:hypothetical protein L6452_22095 [Arctium lappa]|uniref:Uncharacterized protein n=1 Tax=Arctium lappa TaxID=4217 RepID=A0ACB9AZI2_ARCLA|nr:hypothetical protein L6452_22095 [Arctium lappa]